MLWAVLLLLPLGSLGAAKPPHILMLLSDDFGWANVGYHRNPPTKEVVTPNIDSLVREGIELDRHYVYKFCSPTRSSFQSGRLPVHIQKDNDWPTVHNPKDPISGYAGIPRNMTTLATKLKQGGYSTHMVGKWDAGMATPVHTPKGRGYDTSLFYFHHMNDYWNERGTVDECDAFYPPYGAVDLWQNDGPAKGLNSTGYEETMFASHVLNILETHDLSTPLFMFYAFHIVHEPLEVPKEYLDKFAFIPDEYRRIYHAMVNFMDDVVGNLTATLKRRGMWDDTLIVFSTDNGGPVYATGAANNYPLKGGKMNNWEGGIRGNAFASGGYLPASVVGTKQEGYIHIADWYGTFCALAGVDPTDHEAAAAHLPPVDSLNMWPLLSGQVTTSPRTEVHMNNNGLIMGQYKVLVGDIAQAGWTGPEYPNKTSPSGGIATVAKCGRGCLYNIFTDPTEHHDLASTMPDKLDELLARLAVVNKTLFEPDRGLKDPRACLQVRKYGGFYGPWLDLH